MIIGIYTALATALIIGFVFGMISAVVIIAKLQNMSRKSRY